MNKKPAFHLPPKPVVKASAKMEDVPEKPKAEEVLRSALAAHDVHSEVGSNLRAKLQDALEQLTQEEAGEVQEEADEGEVIPEDKPKKPAKKAGKGAFRTGK